MLGNLCVISKRWLSLYHLVIMFINLLEWSWNSFFDCFLRWFVAVAVISSEQYNLHGIAYSSHTLTSSLLHYCKHSEALLTSVSLWGQFLKQNTNLGIFSPLLSECLFRIPIMLHIHRRNQLLLLLLERKWGGHATCGAVLWMFPNYDNAVSA